MIDEATLRRLDLLRALAANPGTPAEGLAAEAAIARILRRHGLTGGRTFGSFWQQFKAERVAEMAKLNVECIDFKRVDRNSLRGFATIRIPEMRLTIRDVAIHQKDGERWAQLPAKPQIDTKNGTAIRDKTNGKIQYSTILEFDDRPTRDAFSAAVVSALLEREPGVFA